MAMDRLEQLYEEYSFYQEYIRYLEAFQKQQVQKDLEKITRDIARAKIEQAIFAIVLQSVDDPDIAASYIASFQVIPIGNRNQILFSPATPVVKILETGVRPFSMKEQLLATGTVKVSKDGFPYKTVPLRHDLASKNAKMDTLQRVARRTAAVSAQKTTLTSKEIQIQAQINSVLQKTKFSFLEEAKDAEGRSIKRSIATNPLDIGGLIKEETFDTAANKASKPIKTKYVIFRTVSAKPGSADWYNPGFSGKEIYSKILNWQSENEEAIFTETLNQLLKQAFGDS